MRRQGPHLSIDFLKPHLSYVVYAFNSEWFGLSVRVDQKNLYSLHLFWNKFRWLFYTLGKMRPQLDCSGESVSRPKLLAICLAISAQGLICTVRILAFCWPLGVVVILSVLPIAASSCVRQQYEYSILQSSLRRKKEIQLCLHWWCLVFEIWIVYLCYQFCIV